MNRLHILCGWLALWMPTIAAASPPATADSSEPVRVENAITKLIKEIDVPAEVAGVLIDVSVREGDRVEAGQVIAKIRDNQLQIELERSRIELKTAQLEYANQLAVKDAELTAAVAANELGRVLAANERNPETYQTAEVERYQMIADRSRLQVEQAKHDREVRKLEQSLAESQMESVAAKLAHYEVKAPWSGLIVGVDASAGKWVEPGTAIARMIDPNRLRIEGFVSSDYSIDELVGQQAEVSLGQAGGEPLTIQGEVVFVSPDVNPVNLQARVFIEVENDLGLLRPGWKVDAVIRPRPTAADTETADTPVAAERDPQQ